MITIVSSTNRRPSNSILIARHVQKLLKARNEESTIVDLADLPDDFITSALYERQGKNLTFNPMIETIKNGEKIIFVIPEYNGSFPGILKTFIDGLEFPAALKEKKTALIGISAGAQGGSLAMSHFTDILNYLGAHVLATKPRITAIDSKMESGMLIESPELSLVKLQIDSFLKY